MQGVASVSSADYVVVLEDIPTSMNVSDLDLQRTIFLPREPRAVRARKAYEKLGAPLAFTHDDIHQAAIWRVMKPFEELVSLEYRAKPLSLSSVTSAITRTKGQRLRVGFLRDLVLRHPDMVDVYGYGWKGELGRSYKGEIGNRFAKASDLAALCKWKGLGEYRYSLAFENCIQANYFSEKIVDCWLAWTMPIYYGCPNLSDYVPKDSYYAIDIAKKKSVDCVAEILARPIGETQISAMREARKLVLHRYNIWPTVREIVAGRRPPQSQSASVLKRFVAMLKGG